MTRFAVYDDRGPAEQWPLINAHLLGPEDLAVGGRVSFRRGMVECRRDGTGACALCLLYDITPMGRLMLQTCLLPERPEPYLLSLELARHRIKLFIAKSEEWQMFDLAAEHPAMKLWERARQLFTQALLAERPPEADRLARRALAHAIDASERLALAHAEILLHRRYGARAASSVTLGVRLATRREGKSLRDLVETGFDVVVLPIRWSALEIEEGRFEWDSLDRWMHWAKEKGKPIVAGPLLDLSRDAAPSWVRVWEHDYEAMRDLAYDFIERIVQRYASMVGIWNLGAGLNTGEALPLSTDQMIDLVRMAGLVVKQVRRGGRTMIELTEPFGEHASERPASLHPLVFLDRLIQEGVRLDAVGVQLLFGERRRGRAARDLAQISSLLDRFALLDLPVLVSAAGVPSGPIDPEGGHWSSGWSPENQSRWASRLMALALSKPFVESVFWAELYDHDEALLRLSGLINQGGKAKPALHRVVSMRRRLRRPLGALKSKSPARSSIVADPQREE